jgi:hypothetical protein
LLGFALALVIRDGNNCLGQKALTNALVETAHNEGDSLLAITREEMLFQLRVMNTSNSQMDAH